jgi:metallo-beta-lactamase family protein
MCSSGRIVNYLKAMLSDPRHNVLFVGYQAQGTVGANIQKYGSTGGFVELEGERCIIRAGVSSLGGYSAHADQQDLLNFVSGIDPLPKQIRLVHGELFAKETLGNELYKLYNTRSQSLELLIPEY